MRRIAEVTTMMKKQIVFLLPLIFLIIMCTDASARLFPPANGLDVHDILADPLAYTGEITVRGGVMNVDVEKKLFEMIDYREYRSCRTVECALKWVTVSYEGDPPEKWDVVEITGIIEKNGSGKGGFIFKTREINIRGTYKR